MSCVPPRKVIATLLSALKARRSGEASSRAPRAMCLAATLIAWPLVLSRASSAIGTGWLFCTTRPEWIR